ncbi:MAG: TetR family transcriptional regulator [Actinobacteria bacterium]|nr:TetR family transcriptional regulator [Actinomycetota bacterium]
MVDGRQLRREQNRQAAVEALVALYRAGRFEPSAAEIAEQAGLSPRSLFRYFDDTEDLARAAIAHHHRLAGPLLAIDATPDDELAVRIDCVVANRLRLWSAIAPSARVARMRAPTSALLGRELRRNRARLRTQLAELFAPEVEGRPEVLAAVDVLCSFESVDLLVNDQRLSRQRAGAALTRALTAVLGGDPR